MAKRQAQLIILCEDLQQEVFARHFFSSVGLTGARSEAKFTPKAKVPANKACGGNIHKKSEHTGRNSIIWRSILQ